MSTNTKNDLIAESESKSESELLTWAEIDLDALRSNFVKIKQITSGAEILAVVKSDAYGHGAIAISKELQHLGVACLGTATANEAVRLREAGISAPILVLAGVTPQQIPLLVGYHLTPAIHNQSSLEALNEFATQKKQPIQFHLKVDTGMGRLGFRPDEAREVLNQKFDYLSVQGVFTHFATADALNDEYTRKQMKLFSEIIGTQASAIDHIHAANSAAILNFPDSHYRLVRPGLLLYGISPMQNVSEFTPILSLKSRIIFLQELAEGERIGYGLTFRASRRSLIATAAIGYNDGVRRALSNRLQVEVQGRMCRVVGTISMDLSMVDVTDVADKVKLYDVVTFLGPKTTAWDWANLLETIPYEITCLIGSRVPRVYYKNEKIVNVHYL